MNVQLVVDLVNKTNEKRTRSIDQATDLLDGPEEIRAFLFAVIASDICAMIDALAYQDELHPLFAKLPRPLQVMGVMGILANLAQDGGKHPLPTPQTLSDVTAAVREIQTVRMELK